MDPKEEKKLLLAGIAELRNQLIYTRGARCLELLERLDTLRLCLEDLIRNEIKENKTYVKAI
jgi:hypothetical protein